MICKYKIICNPEHRDKFQIKFEKKIAVVQFKFVREETCGVLLKYTVQYTAVQGLTLTD